jgi:Anti-sigma factor N-terminus
VKKGIVMEVHDDYVTMLTPEGEFVRTPNQKGNYEIGEEIDFFPQRDYGHVKKKMVFFRLDQIKVAFVSVAALILLIISFLPYYSSNQVYAYMSIDINPSIELGVNRNLQVIKTKALNEEGKKILHNLQDWKKNKIDIVTKQIVELSQKYGYLQKGKEIIITTVVNDKEMPKVEKKLERKIKEIKETYEHNEIKVTAVESDMKTREAALKKGISTGTLLKLQGKVSQDKDIEKEVPDQKKPSSIKKPNESQPVVHENQTKIPANLPKENKPITKSETNRDHPPRPKEMKEKVQEQKKNIEKKIEKKIDNIDKKIYKEQLNETRKALLDARKKIREERKREKEKWKKEKWEKEKEKWRNQYKNFDDDEWDHDKDEHERDHKREHEHEHDHEHEENSND